MITSKIEKKRGQRILSRLFTSGNITKASSKAIVKGRITEEAIFRTATAIITQIKIIKNNTARPEFKGFLLFIGLVCHKTRPQARKYLTPRLFVIMLLITDYTIWMIQIDDLTIRHDQKSDFII